MIWAKSSSASSPIGWCAPSHRCSGDLTISSTSPTPVIPRTAWRISSGSPELELLAISEQAGVFAVKSSDNRRFFITGHPEYDPDTLANEYFRDVNKGLDIAVPENYFAQDDPSRPPVVRWRSAAQLFYTNWLNYYVYQTTPYDLKKISD